VTIPAVEDDEAAAVRVRYARRDEDDRRYSLLEPAVLRATQERQRAIAELFVSLGWRDVTGLRLLEVGCGTGMNLVEFLRMGFRPELLKGIELMPSSLDQARRVLPPTVQLFQGDASAFHTESLPPSSQDIVYQATVFSSLLTDEFQRRLAQAMWSWIRPGGGVLWYDFTVNNPRNSDVRGVAVRRIRQLFPEGTVRARRITLAPPIARLVCRAHPMLYPLFNTCIWLRTHVLVWIPKR
jgi:SAM-dependent methyltransferase